MNKMNINPSNNNYDAKREYLACECMGHSVLSEGIIGLEFFWNGPVPRAGQFFMIKPQRTSVFLSRPLSAAGWKDEGSGGVLRFILAIRGQGTKELAELNAGEKALITGPLGRGWDYVSNGIPRGKVALVSGGVGMAPLAFFAKELNPGSFDFYAGFKSSPFGLEGLKPGSLVISTEDGSAGFKGRILDHFSPAPYGAVYGCGPEPMLKLLTEHCHTAGIPCYISLEQRMACGVGACLGCTIHTKAGNRRCCEDGPVFNAKDIIFDE